MLAHLTQIGPRKNVKNAPKNDIITFHHISFDIATGVMYTKLQNDTSVGGAPVVKIYYQSASRFG